MTFLAFLSRSMPFFTACNSDASPLRRTTIISSGFSLAYLMNLFQSIPSMVKLIDGGSISNSSFETCS